MSLTLNTNVSALTTQQYLGVNTTNTSNDLQQLSSGSRLNSPSDDPADYAIAYSLGVKSASLTAAINNGNQALAMLQVAQGGIETIGNILTQMKQIATEAASSNTDTNDLGALQTQISQFETEINNIASATQYGGTQVLQGGNAFTETAAMTGAGIVSINVANAAAATYTLTVSGNPATQGVTLTMTNANGTSTQSVFLTTTTLANDVAGGQTSTVNFTNFGISMNVTGTVSTLAASVVTVTAGTSSFTYQVGSEDTTVNQIAASIANFSYNNTNGLNLTGDVNSWADAQLFMGQIDHATTWLNGQAGSIGASQDEITYQVSNLTNMNTNTQAAESTIKDTNYASAMSNFTQAQIASQASVAMLTQANSIPQEILTLIKG